jgi:hypothetical protein
MFSSRNLTELQAQDQRISGTRINHDDDDYVIIVLLGDSLEHDGELRLLAYG